MEPEICPFLEEDCNHDKECEKIFCRVGKYTECAGYSQIAFYRKLPLPLVCPFYAHPKYPDKLSQCGGECVRHELTDESDYRWCDKFSQQFWQQLIQQLAQKVENK